MNEQKQVYWTAEVAKQLGVSPPSINRWTRALEELGYPILSGTEGRAYTDSDIEILTQIRDLLKNGPKTKTIEVARQILNLQPGELYAKDDRTRSTRFQDQSNEHERLKKPDQTQLIEYERSKFMEFFQGYQETVTTLEKKIQVLEGKLEERPDVLEIREEQMALWTLEHHVEAELKKEAESAWLSLPSSEREHRIFKGLFPKRVENEEKKRWFIHDFIQQRKPDEVIKRWNERQNLLREKSNHVLNQKSPSNPHE